MKEFFIENGAQFSVGSVEGVPFTACTSGPDIIILASNFSRVQQITTKSHISSLDCSTDVGKIAASYDSKMVIYEPIPLVQQQQQQQTHHQTSPGLSLDYKWVQTATIESATEISVMSFNLEGTKLIAGGQTLQLWIVENGTKNNWQCVWRFKTASTISYLKFSPDGTLFCSASKLDRLVKIWYESVTKTSKFNFTFIYIAHPLPIIGLEWRRTSKYTPKGAIANVLITSCKDNLARVWVQTLLPEYGLNFPGLHFHLAGVIEADLDDLSNHKPQFVVHWINNKEMLITRSIELLLHDMLIRILKGNNQASSTNSPHSPGESCFGSENDTDELEDPNDDTITAESSKKLRHKLCRKVNKKRALAASGRRDIDLGESGSQANSRSHQQAINGRTSPTSLVDEFDKALESLLKRWQTSTDLLFSINKFDGTLTLWQVKYLDGEDTGVFRQVQIDRLSCLKAAISHYDATTMSLNVIVYSPSAYLDVKRAYLAVTNSSQSGNSSSIFSGGQFTPVDVPDILAINTESTGNVRQSCGGAAYEIKDSIGTGSTESEPTIFIVTQHLSGILGLWKFNFDPSYSKVQGIDLVTRITGLPIDPAWLRDGILSVDYDDATSEIITKWTPDENPSKLPSKSCRPFSPWQSKNGAFDFEDAKFNQVSHLPSVDEECPEKSIQSQTQGPGDSQAHPKDSFRASQMASSIDLLPQYHLRQLIELLAFGKLQKVKAILNHLVNCLLAMNASSDQDEKSIRTHPWAHRSRTLSIVGSSSSSFHESFDIDNPSSTIQQQVVEEIELDYIEVTSIRPLPLYQLLDAENEKSNKGDSIKATTRQEFSLQDYENFVPIRSQVDETLDEILGQSALDTLNRQKSLKNKNKSPGDGLLTNFNPKEAKLLTNMLTHTHLPGLTNVDQMHLLAVADAVALFDASPSDYNDMNDDDAYDSSQGGPGISTNIAIDSLDDRGLRFLTAMRQHVYLTRCLPLNQRCELQATGIGNHNLVWAFHSETQDELVSLIPCVSRNKPEWSELREYGVGWWLKKLEVLRKLIEKVAQSAYQSRQDPLDAALFYLAMRKKTLVCALLRRVNCDKRLLKLFEQDFNDPVNRKKALKNAYALLGLHRFEHAAAFFILAGSIWDAVEVCINNLNDIQLAIVLIRLYDSDQNVPNNLKRLLFTEVLGSKPPIETVNPDREGHRNTLEKAGSNAATAHQYHYDPKRAHQDPFLRSMAFWKLSDYLSAVHTLLENNVGKHRPSITQMSSASRSSVDSRRNSDSHHSTYVDRNSNLSGQLSPTYLAGGGNLSVSASVFNFYLFLKDQPLVVKHKQQLLEEIEVKKRTSPDEEEQIHCHRARSLSSGELSIDEKSIARAIKQSSTEFEVLNETIRFVDKYSDEAIAEKERILFLSTAQSYVEAGCPLLALEVLCSEDRLNMSRAQRMKFIACLHILMNELKTLATGNTQQGGFQKNAGDGTDTSGDVNPSSTKDDKFKNRFQEWLRRSVDAMKRVCSYSGDPENPKANEPILRAMLTFCNLHSANENSLTTVRLELLSLLEGTPTA